MPIFFCPQHQTEQPSVVFIEPHNFSQQEPLQGQYQTDQPSIVLIEPHEPSVSTINISFQNDNETEYIVLRGSTPKPNLEEQACLAYQYEYLQSTQLYQSNNILTASNCSYYPNINTPTFEYLFVENELANISLSCLEDAFILPK